MQSPDSSGSQCESEGIQLVQDEEDDEETWEDLLEDEEIAWDPTCEHLIRLRTD